ncbi:MAG: hypothetical protein QOE90_1870 [Thermoplasmata archaeon]|nr:hypothetical protein [Thermoplasmata archaeon]
MNTMADTMTTNYNKLLAMILGWVLVLVGVLGFIPGITQTDSSGTQSVTGVDHPGQILGIFEVNYLHSIVHVLSGAFLLVGAYMSGGANARMFNIILGVVYIVVFLAGFVRPIADLVAINGMDDGLHLVLGIVLLAVPFLVKEEAPMRGSMG